MQNEIKIFYKLKIPRSDKFLCGFCGAYAPLYHALKDKFEALSEEEKAQVLNEGFVAFYPVCPHCFKQANFFVNLELYGLKSHSIKTLKLKMRKESG